MKNKQNIKFLDLAIKEGKIKKEIYSSIKGVINNGEYILGKELEKFEQELAFFCKSKYAIGVASGYDAIFLSLKSLGISKGDEVIVPAMTFISTVLPIIRLGAKPVIADIDPATLTISPTEIHKKITKLTKAIIPVHLYGYPADMDQITNIAKKNNLFVIEDAAQAFGSLYRNKILGNIGDIGCFSFYPTKNLGAFGDGGAIVTNNKKIKELIKIYRNVGQKAKNLHIKLGYNSRLDGIQAAILKVKLKYLNRWNKKRKFIANYYTKELSKLPIKYPVCKPENDVIPHIYAIRTNKRDQLKKYLKKNNIETGIYYPSPIHLQSCLKFLGYKKGDFPESEKLAKDNLALPIYPNLSKKDLAKIMKQIKNFFKNVK